MKGKTAVLTLLVALPITLLGANRAQASTQISSCPVKITAPGVYAVTQDLTCAGTAIIIATSNVDLHLGGHTISGSGVGNGVEVQGGANISIHHGAVQGFELGIFLNGAQNCKLNNLVVSRNVFHGIQLLTGTGNSVTGNLVSQNPERGINVFLGSGNTVARNTCTQNGSGIDISDFSFGNTVVRNTCTQNSNGIILWVGSSQNTVQDNTCSGNFIGIRLLANATGNTLQSNTTNLNVLGIWVEQDCTGNSIQRNTAQTNRDFDLGDQNPGCDSNAWSSNSFSTDFVAGLGDGGPGAGCIR